MIIAFLVLINPVALFIYLQPIMKELSDNQFMKVLIKASIISFIIFALFLIFGDVIFRVILQINFESFRIFGGILIFSFAAMYILRGQEAIITMRENLDDLASEIALPFMIGAGTISLTVLTAYKYHIITGVLILSIVLTANFISILSLKIIKDRIPSRKLSIAFDKNMQILLRLNGFFLGAIGVNMIVTGITNIL